MGTGVCVVDAVQGTAMCFSTVNEFHRVRTGDRSDACNIRSRRVCIQRPQDIDPEVFTLRLSSREDIADVRTTRKGGLQAISLQYVPGLGDTHTIGTLVEGETERGAGSLNWS